MPVLDVVAGYPTPSPSITQGNEGRYFYDEASNLCVGEFNINGFTQMVSTASNLAFLVVSLPLPAQQFDGAAYLGAVRPVGLGLLSAGLFELNGNAPVTLCLSPYNAASGIPSSQLVMGTCPPFKFSGTASAVSGVCSVTFPYTLPYTPTAADLVITPTSNMGTDKYWVSAISASGFTITVTKTGPTTDTASSASFGWKLVCEGSSGLNGPSFLATNTPYLWNSNTSGYSWRGQFRYEVAR
jgi:hypothetical protein